MSGTITRIEKQQKRSDRVNVYLNDAFAFSLAMIVAEAEGMRPGMFLSDALVEELLQRDAFQKAIDSALRYLSYRPRSEKEVRQNLLHKKLAPPLIDKVIQRLTEIRMIDDAAFAQFWVQNREAFSPRSERALRFELRGKGVDQVTVDDTVEGAVDEEASACAAGRKKLRALGHLEYKDFRNKIGAYLARRGFHYEVINVAVNKLWQEAGAGGRICGPEDADE